MAPLHTVLGCTGFAQATNIGSEMTQMPAVWGGLVSASCYSFSVSKGRQLLKKFKDWWRTYLKEILAGMLAERVLNPPNCPVSDRCHLGCFMALVDPPLQPGELTFAWRPRLNVLPRHLAWEKKTWSAVIVVVTVPRFLPQFLPNGTAKSHGSSWAPVSRSARLVQVLWNKRSGNSRAAGV